MRTAIAQYGQLTVAPDVDGRDRFERAIGKLTGTDRVQVVMFRQWPPARRDELIVGRVQGIGDNCVVVHQRLQPTTLDLAQLVGVEDHVPARFSMAAIWTANCGEAMSERQRSNRLTA